MPLAVGTRLGPYEIVAPIGMGGMGEVWKALDTRLGRDVAIKLSKEQYTDRFTREARALAALNHPNLCHLYDVGPNYIVLEYVEGAMLQGPVPLDDALPIIQQLIDGIEVAHEKNIIHRDLKPANIKITSEGTVKILDFGLAKAMDAPHDEANPEDSPTLTVGATQAGAILGTVAYMSPEQAKGKTADRRSDIWSFGAVVYELLTGKKPFAGETAVEILGSVLNREPDWAPVPVHLRRLLQRCLQKDRNHRLGYIGDARWMIDEAQASQATTVLSRGIKPGWIAATAVLAIIAATLAFVHFRPAKQELKPLVRLDVDLGPDVSLGPSYGPEVILSRDGTRMVYVSKGKLFARRLDQPKAAELAGTEGARDPFFSPDGQSVAFFTPVQLKKISLEGGPPTTLCQSGITGSGAAWHEDGTLIVGAASSGLLRLPADGCISARRLTELAEGEIGHYWPQILPGGKTLLFGTSDDDIYVVSLNGGGRKRLVRGGRFGRYLSSGHLVYVNDGTLYAVGFDLSALEVRGRPTPVLEGIARERFAFSESGMFVYQTGATTAGGFRSDTVQWMDSAGKTEGILSKPGAYVRPQLSPDGQRLAVESSNLPSDIWIYELRRETMTRLTFNAGIGNMTPVWTPDGRYLVFYGKGGMYWTRSDGGSNPQPLTRSTVLQVPFSFNGNGDRLAWQGQSESDQSGGYGLWTAPIESKGAGLKAGKPEVFLKGVFNALHPMFSADGRWIAYSSTESGGNQVYVRAFPDRGGKWQISNDGGQYPVWSRAGRDLFFRSNDGRIMVASYSVNGDSFVPEKPRVWSERQISLVGQRTYDVAPDGKRIVAVIPAETSETQRSGNHVVMLENFFDELRRKVPVTK